jgi:hypothetical protein
MCSVDRVVGAVSVDRVVDPSQSRGGRPARHEPARQLLDDVPLIPYHRWANRGPSTMRVWLPA